MEKRLIKMDEEWMQKDTWLIRLETSLIEKETEYSTKTF